MDRLNQLRGEAGGSRDSTLDTSSPPSEAFMTANESSSKYFSLSEVDSTFDISPIKDISLSSATVESSEKTVTESDQLISNLSPIGKKSDFDTYKIGKQIEAANILSGGVDIFDDNDNSYDGDELVIDDNAEIEEKSNPELKLADSQFKVENSTEATLVETDAVPSKDTEVILQIDGKNVDAIDIGNGLYLYRKEGQEELAAVQIIDDDQQQPSFKFLKVRENSEGNLEVYEEIQIEVPKEVPVKEEKIVDKNLPHVPIKDISKVISDSTSNKIAERKINTQNIPKPKPAAPAAKEPDSESTVESESKSDNSLNKKMKFSDSRKSPVIGSFTPMTFHSTPNKEGRPLTKTMVDLQLHPSRHSDNVKKTIEVHTDNVKQRILESPCKQTKDVSEDKDQQSLVDTDARNVDNVAPLNLDNKDAIKEVVSNVTLNDDENIEEEKLIIDETVQKESETVPAITLPDKDDALTTEKSEDLMSCDSVKKVDSISTKTAEVIKLVEPEINKNTIEVDKVLVTAESKQSEVIDENKSSVNTSSDESALNKISETDLQGKGDETKSESTPITVVGDKLTDNKTVQSKDVPELKELTPEPVIQDVTKSDSNNATSLSDVPIVKSVIDASDTKLSAPKDTTIFEGIKITETDSVQKVKPDSTDVVKKEQLINIVTDKGIDKTEMQKVESSQDISDNPTSKIQNTESSPNVCDSSKQNILNAESSHNVPDSPKPKIQAIEMDQNVSDISKPKTPSSKLVQNLPDSTKPHKSELSLNVSDGSKLSLKNTETIPNVIDSSNRKIPSPEPSRNIPDSSKPTTESTELNQNVSDVSKTKTQNTETIQHVSDPISQSSEPSQNISDSPKQNIQSAVSGQSIFNSFKPKIQNVVPNLNASELPKLKIQSVVSSQNILDSSNPKIQNVVPNLNIPEISKPNIQSAVSSQSILDSSKPKIQNVLPNLNISEISKPNIQSAVSSQSILDSSKPKIQNVVPNLNITEISKPSIQSVVSERESQNVPDNAKSNIKNIEPSKSVTDSSKLTTKNIEQNISGRSKNKEVTLTSNKDSQSKKEPSAVSEIVKTTDNILETHKQDDKEKRFLVEPEHKKSNDAIDKKSTTCLKKDVKDIVTEPSGKLVIDLVETPKPAMPVSDSSKTAPKSDIQPIKDKQIHEIKKQDAKPGIKQQDIKQNVALPKNDLSDKKVVSKVASIIEPMNNNHAPVPFGKWTDVNRQAFLNKIRESKVPTNSSNGKQIKNSNDLNRRDVLKKIDSQRQAQELANMSRLGGVKKETAFATKPSAPQDNKPSVSQDNKPKPSAPQDVKPKPSAPKDNKPQPPAPQDNKSTVKTEIPILKNNQAKKITKQETVAKPQTVTTSIVAAIKKEANQRKEIHNQDVIDRTIEGIINRAVAVKNTQEGNTQAATKDPSSVAKSKDLHVGKPVQQTPLDAIEMKMNELHGIPFIERPPHELPHVQKPVTKSFPKSEPQKVPAAKSSKIPNLLPYVAKIQKGNKDNIVDLDSEEEVIEHEPITGDMDVIKKDTRKLLLQDKASLAETVTLISADSSKKETIITENDFDKFARRNSINYENCLTVNFDINEPYNNVVQTVVQKDLKTYSKSEMLHGEKLITSRKHEQYKQNSISKPVQSVSKFGNVISEDDCNKNYQSKVKMAYQTAMTAKRQSERPITIIEDRPVKVVYMDSNAEYISTPLNVQGQDLSPCKKPVSDLNTTQISDSLDSDTLDSIDEGKVVDESKVKTKHQRKQVLTPVETPELELIAPDDLGIEVSPKKKRRTEEKVDKNTKTLVPKKSYLLGRGNKITEGIEESTTKAFDLTKSSQRETTKQETSVVAHKNTASAIDSLVKAAELLETQSATVTSKSPDVPQTPESQQNTPVKRGRGRPRKYPLPEGGTDKSKVPSPQKKPRLIDAKPVKNKDTDDDDDSTDDDEMVKENWTMGKINENIVCPICNKLFRSENVVFKHVKHCTGPSPSRSDSDNKSPRRLRDSQEFETKSFGCQSDDMDIDETITPSRESRKKRKSKDRYSKSFDYKDDVIVIEDTPIKPKIDRRDENKIAESRKTMHKNKVPDKVTSLVCEFCGKTFRQLSYLVSHKLQHGKDDAKKNEHESSNTTKSVFSCETCKKEFRKLHHLVQHRIIHNPSSASAKLSRKSSSEQTEHKSSKDQNPGKHTDDPSAGFRCEPCDKSFRKLHHLVEHRETHDGINRQKISSTGQPTTEKLPPPPQCDVCKKTFRKLHHLIEHKEQHLETSSEKSDDKSIKSSLSTKDIIHECSLCYMVFPNEHSLNKHTIICQRKKRQSATKQLKLAEEGDKSEGDKDGTIPEDSNLEKDDDVTIIAEEFPTEHKAEQQEKVVELVKPKIEEKSSVEESLTKPAELIPVEHKESPKIENVTENKTQNIKPENTNENIKPENENVVEAVVPNSKAAEDLSNVSIKVKKPEDKVPKPKIQETLRKKTLLKDKATPTVTKRHKPNIAPPVVDETKPAESSDDDEIRYMLNPDYKFEDNEGKLFMKVRANKRNSLQIERPNSKDLVKRRISLQHPPKVPRLKPKTIQNKAAPSTVNSVKPVVKAPKPEPMPSTDSDDSDVKYSFPEPPAEDTSKPSKTLPETSANEPVKKAQRKSLAEKRKSLSSIAKRKSLGKAVEVKHKVKASPLKQVRKRTAEVEHRCDCGQLFSSAALLSRHTTLAHTPPRIRRRRSPLPEMSAKTVIKPAPRKLSVAAKTRPSADSRKSSVKSDTNPTWKTNQPSMKRKSSNNKTEPKTPNENRKSPKSSDKTESVKSATSNVKLRRYAAHKGVPVPEKMRKLMEKSKK